MINVRQQFQHAIGRAFNNIDITKQMALVLLIDFAFTDKDMIERFLDEHMQYVTLFMLE